MNRFKLIVVGAAAAVPLAGMALFASAAGPNLVGNPDFTNGVAGWDNFSGNPQPHNGTMKVTNNYQGTGYSYYSGWYCVSGIVPGTTYTATGQAFVEANAPANTGASLGTHFYASNNCSGGNMNSGGGLKYGGFNANERGQWITLSFNEVAPAGANSVRVRATAVKHPNPSSTSIPGDHIVLFDNIYYGEAGQNPTPTNTPTNTPAPKPTNTPVPTATPKPKGEEPKGETPPLPGPIGVDGPIFGWPEPVGTPAKPSQPQATPTSKPTEKPADQPTQAPADPGQPQPQAGEPVVTDEPIAESGQTVPLPPATGNTGHGQSSNSMTLLLLAGGAMLAGLGGTSLAALRRK